MSRNRTWLIAALLAGSGFCALVFQVAWLREFRLIFGASTAASAAVLAIFIGGLGVGGFLLGPRADRQDQPLRFYATLEAIVAISAALAAAVLRRPRALSFQRGSTSLGAFVATAGRLILSAIVLAVPTVAMGGTLPAAARAATRDTDTRRQDVAALYALNTLGAVVGCIVATFWMLEAVGTHATIWIAAACNLLVAGAAWFVRLPAPSFVEGKPDATSAQHQAPGTAALSTQAFQHPAPGTSTAPAWFLLFASGAVGFAFFLMELVWYRMLSPLLGGSVFTFGLVLAVALAGIGLGGLLYALVAGDKPASMSGFATICLLEGAAVAATFAAGDRLAVLAMALQPLEVAGFPAHIAGWTIVTALIVLPPALIAGYQFPQLIALFGQGRSRVGEQVGLAYAANTIGAIAGSLAGGFGLLPWLSAPGAWQLTAVLLLVLGAVAAVKGDKGTRTRSIPLLATQLVLILAAVVLVR
jgi:predicted membrane-bound spermidine synthase